MFTKSSKAAFNGTVQAIGNGVGEVREPAGSPGSPGSEVGDWII